MNGPFPLSPLRIVVLISGGGRTLRNLLDQRRQGKLDIEIPLVISSSGRAKGLEFAEAEGIPAEVVPRGDYPDDASYGAAMFDRIRACRPHLVVMAGYVKFLPIPADFAGRVLNIHPSLIPDFCGQGMYGHHVHEAVIRARAATSGCTVHFVDNEYDHGPIVLQRSLPVLADDTPETLAARVFAAECEAYPEALRRYAAGEVNSNEPPR